MEIVERKCKITLSPEDVKLAVTHWLEDGCPGSDDCEEEIHLEEDASVKITAAGGKAYTSFVLEIEGEEST